MLGRASYKYSATPNANEKDGVEDLYLVSDWEGGNSDDAAFVAAQVVPAAATASVSEEGKVGLIWTDDYFADRTDIVAVFDFNQDEYARSKNECTKWLSLCSIAMSVSTIMFALGVLPDGVWHMSVQFCSIGVSIAIVIHVRKIVWIPHVAVTTTGVRYVEPPEKKSRFLGSTVHIPLEDIEAIEIDRSASVLGIRTSSADWTEYVESGAPRGLRKIRRNKLATEWNEEIVEDDQDGDGTRLDIKYLQEPCLFKKLVMSLKQQQQEAKLDKKEEEIGRAVVSL